MRLSDHERATIKDLAEAHFGAGCVVRLFGSRVDRLRRGGDIDLHLEPATAEDATFAREIAFSRALRDALGDQKVDPGAGPRLAPDRQDRGLGGDQALTDGNAATTRTKPCA